MVVNVIRQSSLSPSVEVKLNKAVQAAVSTANVAQAPSNGLSVSMQAPSNTSSVLVQECSTPVSSSNAAIQGQASLTTHASTIAHGLVICDFQSDTSPNTSNTNNTIDNTNPAMVSNSEHGWY